MSNSKSVVRSRGRSPCDLMKLRLSLVVVGMWGCGAGIVSGDPVPPSQKDSVPPLVSSGAPTGTLAGGTTQATLSVATNEPATCGWDSAPGTSYASMTSFKTTGGTSHSTQLTGLVNSQSYNYYVRCQDGSGNADTSDYVVSFAVGNSAGPIIVSATASRLTGVAPLAVFFDATSTTATATTRPFHDLEYRWNFGDALGSPISGTTWSTGSRPGVSSRNTATGPVAAHVFERPGTYTVVVTVTDGTNTVSDNTTQIVVQDPEVVFSGTHTTCVAAASLPVAGTGGCPAGANVAQQPSFPAAISAYAQTGARLLLKRGDTFTAATEAVITATGPGTVGAYGSGGLPIIQMTGNTNVLGFSSAYTPTFSDWRIMDLFMDGMGGNGTCGTGISSLSGGASNILVLRLTYAQMNNAIGFSSEMPNYRNNYADSVNRPDLGGHKVDLVAVVDSIVLPAANTVYSAYDAGNRMAFLGNSFDNGGNPAGSHVTRWPFLNKAVISNNDFLRPGFTRLTIKLHGSGWNAVRNDGVFDPTATHPRNGPSDWANYSVTAEGDGYTKYVVIADNRLAEAANPWSVDIGPEDIYNDERIHDVIVERNLFVANTASQVSLRISEPEITVRNNIFDMSNGSSYQNPISITKDGITPALSNVRIYNNTFYSSHAVPSGQFVAVSIDATSSAIVANNNLAYAPNATGPVMFSSGCGACLTQSNNSSNGQIQSTSPLFMATPPVLVTDWTPTGSSYAIGGGTSIPVWSDFLLNDRPQSGVPGTIDMGAIEVP